MTVVYDFYFSISYLLFDITLLSYLAGSGNAFPQTEVTDYVDSKQAESKLPANCTNVLDTSRLMDLQDIPPV